ncbi:predicted protein [Postia placenta Mad-698-R]|uniref:Anaphase-promoting complex subunit 4 WD40 domain-containing protein n=1 Tax=Postia placenta MAD-698-R-SB12 TaxID=670580 RepID=A0A1X6MSE4_9APHY|nr:hypothetical protein POSPLADRAFT_1048635 [Postia placenta MAD-698-R-SB12]EED80759.1 predicted protein [Postia placenta Mad-698-R]OSX59298.1 hypothetical protein POSPLADRAFT_1048635 [Postia placenta MAD-698-R-SB12]
MSMAAHPQKAIACGVNSSAENLKDGKNENCRVYTVKEDKIYPSNTQSTLELDSTEDDFQKVTVFSPTGSLLAVAGTHDLSVLHYPSLSLAASPIHIDKGEIYDATFSSSTLVVATTVNLLVYALPPSDADAKRAKAYGKKKESTLAKLELLKTIDRPTLPGKDAGSSFRAARYHPHDEKVLYTVLNTVPPRTRTKSSPRRAFRRGRSRECASIQRT